MITLPSGLSRFGVASVGYIDFYPLQFSVKSPEAIARKIEQSGGLRSGSCHFHSRTGTSPTENEDRLVLFIAGVKLHVLTVFVGASSYGHDVSDSCP